MQVLVEISTGLEHLQTEELTRTIRAKLGFPTGTLLASSQAERLVLRKRT